MKFRILVTCVAAVLLASPGVQAQGVKKAPGVLLATYLFADLAGDTSGLLLQSGADGSRDGADVWVWSMMVKDEQGRHLLLPVLKDHKITANGKATKDLVSGAKIAITFAPNNPLLVVAVDIREQGKGEFGPDVFSDRGKFGSLKNNLFSYERRSGQLFFSKLEKDTTITAGRTSIKVEDIQPDQAIVLTREKGRLVAITMLPDDTARLQALTTLGLRATPKAPPSGRLGTQARRARCHQRWPGALAEDGARLESSPKPASSHDRSNGISAENVPSVARGHLGKNDRANSETTVPLCSGS